MIVVKAIASLGAIAVVSVGGYVTYDRFFNNKKGEPDSVSNQTPISQPEDSGNTVSASGTTVTSTHS